MAVIMTFGLIGLMAACGSDSEPNADPTTTSAGPGTTAPAQKVEQTLRLGTLKIANTAPQVADPSIFSKNGITLDISYSTSGAAIIPGVIGGSYDVGYGSCSSVVQAVSEGLPIQVIAPADISVGDVVVLASSGITDAKGLEGKTVATNALKSTVDLDVQVVVDNRGGDASKVKFLEVPFPAQLAALDGGTINAAVLPEPFLSQAKANPKYKALFSIFDVSPHDITNCYFASTAFLGKSAQAARQFVESVSAANKFATDKPDVARQAVATITGAPAAAVAGIALPQWLSAKMEPADVKVLVDRMVKFKFIDKAPATEKILWQNG
jgi:NitT/TauT family transport system substrate-binding protein